MGVGIVIYTWAFELGWLVGWLVGILPRSDINPFHSLNEVSPVGEPPVRSTSPADLFGGSVSPGLVLMLVSKDEVYIYQHPGRVVYRPP